MNRSVWMAVALLLAGNACAREEEAPMKKTCMESTLAGSWYDADPGRLRTELEGYAKNGQVKQLEAPLLRLDEAYQQALEAFGREFPGLG